MIFSTSKLLSPLSKALNHSTGEFSTHSTGFNNSLWGNQTRGLIKLINKKLRLESYNKIVAGAQDITKKTRGPIRSEEIIDLMIDKPPDGFVIFVDISSDDNDDNSKITIIENDHVGHKTCPVNNINNKSRWQTLEGMNQSMRMKMRLEKSWMMSSLSMYISESF